LKTTGRQTAFRSGVVVMGSSFLVQFLRAVSIIVLARLLSPDDFGLVSLAVVFIGATVLISGVGMTSAIIASQEENIKTAYHGGVITAFTGTSSMIIIIIFAPLCAQLFERLQLISVIRWMSVLVILQTFNLVPKALLMKEMMFGRLVLPNTAAPLSRMIVSIAMAYAGYGYWSLVAGQVAGGLIGLICCLAVCPSLGWLKPQKWDFPLAKVMCRFGLTTMSTGAVQYVYNQGDYVVVGKILGTADLGYYTQAYNLANLPVNTVSMVANSVLFPAYAKIRGETERLARAFLSSFRLVSALTIPMAAGLFILTPDLVITLIGEKWQNCIPILRVFSILSLVRPLSGVTSSFFLAVNRPGFNLRTAVIQCVLMIVFIFTFFRYGAPGVALGVVSAFLVGLIYNFYLVCWKTGIPISIRDLLSGLIPTFLSSAIMAGVVIGVRPMLTVYAGTHNIFLLAELIASGILTYTCSLFVLDRKIVIEVRDHLLTMLPKIRRYSASSSTDKVHPSDGIIK